MGFWRNKTFTLSDIQGKVKINGFDLNDLILSTEYISSLSYDGEKLYANNNDITHYLKKLKDYKVTIESEGINLKKKDEENLPGEPQPIVLEKDAKKDAEDKTLIFSGLSIQIEGSVGEVSCEESFDLKADNIKGNIQSEDHINITANTISGNISSGTAMTINGDVSGDINAEENIDIAGNVTSDDISGSDISIKGNLTAKDISADGNLSVGGDLSAADFSISGDVTVKGSIKANDVSADGDIKASGTIAASEINAEGSVYMNLGKNI